MERLATIIENILTMGEKHVDQSNKIIKKSSRIFRQSIEEGNRSCQSLYNFNSILAKLVETQA